MTLLEQITGRIIKAQEGIIGAAAWSEAMKVKGITIVNKEKGDVSLTGNGGEIIDSLMKQYEHLFGIISDKVCKESASDLIAELKPDEIPEGLK